MEVRPFTQNAKGNTFGLVTGVSLGPQPLPTSPLALRFRPAGSCRDGQKEGIMKKSRLLGVLCTYFLSFVLISHAHATSIFDIPNLLQVEVCRHWSSPGSFECTGLFLDELKANPDTFLELPGLEGQVLGGLTDRNGSLTGGDDYYLLRVKEGESVWYEFASISLLFNDFSREYTSYAAVDFGPEVDLSSAIGGITPWPGINLEGGWIFGFESATVPIPASVWLFGSGLLGLIGIARRKKS